MPEITEFVIITFALASVAVFYSNSGVCHRSIVSGSTVSLINLGRAFETVLR